MAKKKKKEEKEITTLQFIGYYIKEILSALALIAFGIVLLHYTPTISKWFGDMVQEAAESVFGPPQE